MQLAKNDFKLLVKTEASWQSPLVEGWALLADIIVMAITDRCVHAHGLELESC